MKIERLKWTVVKKTDSDGNKKKIYYARTVFGSIYFSKEEKKYYLNMWIDSNLECASMGHPVMVHKHITKCKTKSNAKKQAERINKQESLKWIEKFIGESNEITDTL